MNRFSEPFQQYALERSRAVNPLGYARAVARRRTTIRELAEHTGLSPAAVSYALRGLHVSAETEQRVREAAEELGYEADPIARALAGGATGVVGLLVGSLSDFWNQDLVRAVQRHLYDAALSSLVADADGEPARELELAQRLVDQRVDGLVVVPIGPASGGWTAIARQISTVTIGDALPGVAPAGEVVFDYERGVLQSLQHLSTLGHRRVTVLSWAVETLARTARPSARSRAPRTPWASTAASSPARTRSTPPARWHSSCSPGPTARARSCACPTRSPMASTPPASELGLSIPDDVAIAGFGDHPISRLLSPPLTSTVWDVEQVAERATEFLIRAIGADGPQATLREVIAPVLAARASTDA